ncbi:hypothetical protein T190820D02B_40062 [Tenacibaculum sp. 190524A05c]
MLTKSLVSNYGEKLHFRGKIYIQRELKLLITSFHFEIFVQKIIHIFHNLAVLILINF